MDRQCRVSSTGFCMPATRRDEAHRPCLARHFDQHSDRAARRTRQPESAGSRRRGENRGVVMPAPATAGDRRLGPSHRARPAATLLDALAISCATPVSTAASALGFARNASISSNRSSVERLPHHVIRGGCALGIGRRQDDGQDYVQIARRRPRNAFALKP
jgi:hypothetical protein